MTQTILVLEENIAIQLVIAVSLKESDIIIHRETNPELFVHQNQFYDHLQQTWTLAAKFVGPNLIGSEIRIYKNPNPPTTPDLYSPELYATLEGASIAVARDLLSQLARLYREGGWHPKAIDIYQNLLPIVPNRSDLYAELATSYYALDFKEQAITAYEHALKLDNNNTAILTNLDHVNNLLFIYTQQNQRDRAVKLLLQAQKHHPDNTELQSALKALTQ